MLATLSTKVIKSKITNLSIYEKMHTIQCYNPICCRATSTKQIQSNVYEARNGSYTISPTLPKDGMIKAGTVLTLKQLLPLAIFLIVAITLYQNSGELCFMNNLHLSSK